MTKDSRPRQRIYPTGTAYFPGVAAVERVVPADVADLLVGAGAFTRERPADQKGPDPDAREDIDDIERELLPPATDTSPPSVETVVPTEEVNPNA